MPVSFKRTVRIALRVSDPMPASGNENQLPDALFACDGYEALFGAPGRSGAPPGGNHPTEFGAGIRPGEGAVLTEWKFYLPIGIPPFVETIIKALHSLMKWFAR